VTALAARAAEIHRMRTAGLFWGAVGVIAFSVSLPATRLAITGGLDGVVVGVGRGVVAGVLAALVLAAGRQGWPTRSLLLRLAAVSLGVVLGFPLLTSLALAHVPAAHGIIVVGLIPAATAIVAVLRAGERPSLAFWIAAAAGLGCTLLFALTRNAGELGAADILLLGAVLSAGFGYAEGGALAREMGGPRVICWALVLALPFTASATLLSIDVQALAAVRPSAWAGFGYLSLVSMFLGFFAWYRGLALGGIARIGQLQLAQPVLSLAWAALFLGEAITWTTLAAALAVLACVFATQLSR